MPRKPKLYFKKQSGTWCFSTGGKRYSLGPDREEAERRFNEMMADKSLLTAHTTSLYELSQAYLDWVEDNRRPGTYRNHRDYLKSFFEYTGKALRVAQLRKRHLTAWVNSHSSWSSTTRNDAMGVVVRLLNWAVEEEYLERNPLPKLKKPPRKRREIFYTQEQWDAICSHVSDGFIDYLNFIWLTGCRPKEARDIEAKHIHGKMVMFKTHEAKGERARVVYLTDATKEIVDRLSKEYPTGPLFRNRRGNKWTKDAVKCRLTRISKKVGFRVIAYGARHSFATEGLINGVDSTVLGMLMGHADASMVQRTYQHLAKNPQFLADQAKRVKNAS